MVLFCFLSFRFFLERKSNQDNLTHLSIPYSISIDHMNPASDIRCSIFFLTTNSTSKNLYKEKYSKYNNNNASCQYLFKGEKLELFGTFSPSQGKFDLYLDGKKISTINHNKRHKVECTLQYSSKNLSYHQHKIEEKLIGKPFEICHFSFWPLINEFRLNASEMQISDSCFLNSTLKQNKKSSISIKCLKISNEYNDQITFLLDEKLKKLIKKKNYIKNCCDFQYETNDFILSNHKLDFLINGNASINCVYFLTDRKINNKGKNNTIMIFTLNSLKVSSIFTRIFVLIKYQFDQNKKKLFGNNHPSDFNIISLKLDKNQSNSNVETKISEKENNFYEKIIERKTKFKKEKFVILTIAIELFILFTFLLIAIISFMQRMFSTEDFNEYPLIIL